MRVTVLFFGALKEITGRSRDSIELSAGSSLETLFEIYASQFPKLREMASSIAVARNQEFSDLTVPLAEGDEVALMPPVSGGADADEWIASTEDANALYALTERPIDAQALSRRVLRASDGAVVVFEGVVRDNSAGRKTRVLDYECYPPMALKMMREIGGELLAGREIGSLAMVHRVGRLGIGEASVAIAVAAPHRRPAFEACLEAIDRLKKSVPIWKKEHFEDGEVWVEGEWDDSVRRPAPATP